MNRKPLVLGMILLFVGLFRLLVAAQTPSGQQTTPASPRATGQALQPIPVMDGEAGPCSLELTVTSADGKAVYAAIIKVHMAYGFGGIRKLDLQAGTNWEGKVRFMGLPARVRRPPLEFHATKDQMVGTATFDPEAECQAKHDLFVDTPKAPTTK